jgi:hypothetical protein
MAKSEGINMKVVELLHDILFYGTPDKYNKKDVMVLVKHKMIDDHGITKAGRDYMDRWFARGADRVSLLKELS